MLILWAQCYSNSVVSQSHSCPLFQSHMKPYIGQRRLTVTQAPCLPEPCWAGVFSMATFCSGFHLGRKESVTPALFPTFRVFQTRQAFHVLHPFSPGTGIWLELYSEILISEHLSSLLLLFSQAHGAVISSGLGKLPLAYCFCKPHLLTQTLQSESSMTLSPDTQNPGFSNSMKISFPPPTTAIVLNFTSPF